MSVMRGVGLSLAVSIMTFTLVLLTIGLSVNVLLYPQIYMKSLKESGAFDYAAAQLGNDPGASFIKLPAGGIEELAGELLNNLLSYLRSDTDELSVRVDIDQPKLLSFFLSQLEGVPTCPGGIQPDFENLERMCIRDGQTSEELLDEMLAARNLSFFAQTSVDLVDIYDLGEGSEGRAKLENIREIISSYHYALIGFIILSVLLIVSIFFLELHKTKKFLLWTGVPVMLAGLITTIVAMVFVRNALAAIPELPIEFLAQFIDVFVDTIISRLYMYANILTSLGCILIIISFFVHSAADKPAPTTAHLAAPSSDKKEDSVKKNVQAK